MSLQPSGRTAELIDKLVSHAQKKLPKGQTKQVEAFLRDGCSDISFSVCRQVDAPCSC